MDTGWFGARLHPKQGRRFEYLDSTVERRTSKTVLKLQIGSDLLVRVVTRRKTTRRLSRSNHQRRSNDQTVMVTEPTRKGQAADSAVLTPKEQAGKGASGN